MFYAPISVNTATDNVLVNYAALFGANLPRKIVVVNYVLIAAGTVNVTWGSQVGGVTTAISGAFPLTAQAGASANGMGRQGGNGRITGVLRTINSGDNLVLTLSGGIGVFGHFAYDLE